jgi:large repetitive protein
MKGLKPFLSLTAGFLAFITMVGCAGSIPKNGPGALNIAQFTLSNGVIGLSYKQLLVASGGVQPYTWGISSGTLPPGITLTTDGILSGTPTTLGMFTFTAKVVDSQSPIQATNSLTTSITINPVLSFVSSPLPTGLVGGSYSATVAATNGLPPYNYTLAFGSLPGGLTLDAVGGTITGTPTTAGVFNFTLEAQDSDNEVSSAAFTITVVGRLQGPYVLYFNGFDNGQPFYDVASLVTDGNGNITSGVLDQIGPGGTPGSAVPITGTYSLSQTSNFGTLTLTRGDNNVSLNFAIIVSTTGDTKVILNNTSNANEPAYGSGLLKKQTLTAIVGSPANYSFGEFGNNSSGGRFAGAGMFALGTVAGGAQPITGGEEDLNDAGTVSLNDLITGGTLTQLDPNSGRGTYSVITAAGTANYTFYVVSTTELVSVGTDASANVMLVDLLAQQTVGASGSFSNATLKGQSVLELNGLTNSGSAPSAAIGVATFDGAGNIARTDGLNAYYTDESDGGTVSTVTYTSGTYNVDATCGTITQACGRVTVTLTGAPTQPVWYLVTVNQAFSVDTNAGVMAGTLQAQTVPTTPPGFQILNLLGSYLADTITPVSSTVTNELDVSGTPPPGGLWLQNYNYSGLIGYGQGSFLGSYDCGGTAPACSTIGAAFGRFEVTGPGSGTAQISILYVLGSGSPGTTGSKGGVVGINVGQQSDGTVDPNPRLTLYTR